MAATFFDPFFSEDPTSGPAKVAERALALLGDDRLKEILMDRFGLNGQPKTHREIGEKFGVGRERISSLEGKALRLLRHPKRIARIKEWIEDFIFPEEPLPKAPNYFPKPPPPGTKWVSQHIPQKRFRRAVTRTKKEIVAVPNVKEAHREAVVDGPLCGPLVGNWAGYIWKCGRTHIFEGSGRRGVFICESKMQQIVSRLQVMGYAKHGYELVSRERKWRQINFFRPTPDHGGLWMIVYRTPNYGD